MAKRHVVVCAALVLAIAAFLASLGPYASLSIFGHHLSERSFGNSQHSAHKADLDLVSRLGVAPLRLVHLTDAQESFADVLRHIEKFRALVVVTAGQGGPNRRAQSQPFISIAQPSAQPGTRLGTDLQEGGGGRAAAAGAWASGAPSRRLQGDQQGQEEDAVAASTAAAAAAAASSAAGPDGTSSGDVSGNSSSSSSGGDLAALAGPVALMNAAAAGVERVLGRRLYPITISLFDRGGAPKGGPYAIFDVSAGVLLLDRQMVSYTWAGDRPEVSYITRQLSSRVFDKMAAVLRGWPDTTTTTATGATAAAEDVFGPGATADTATTTTTAEDAAAAPDTIEDSMAAAAMTLTQLPGSSAAAVEGGAVQDVSAESPEKRQARDREDFAVATLLTSMRLRSLSRRNVQEVAAAASSSSAAASETPHQPLLASSSFPTSSSSSAAAAAMHVAAAAVGAALPAAFAAAPPLWFCILCPSVLGLLAPLAINLALNQIAGALCTQLHLSDDACFDVLLGALGAGFVLSLASAVPIFFVCQLPQCAGRNVTAALRGLMRGL